MGSPPWVGLVQTQGYRMQRRGGLYPAEVQIRGGGAWKAVVLPRSGEVGRLSVCDVDLSGAGGVAPGGGPRTGHPLPRADLSSRV